MKANLISKIFFLFICFCAFASAAYTQVEKPQVIEFAQVEIKMGETDIDKFIEPLEKFISSLKNEPETTRGFIEIPENTELGEKIKLVVANSGLESRVGFWKAMKYPERYWFRSRVYFYFIPQGADPFKIRVRTPCICPTLDVIAPEGINNQNSILTFKAKVGDDDIEGLSYKWYLSAGKIIEGQGTKIIKVDAQDAKEITAKVEIGGFCDTCYRWASFTTKIQ